MGKDTQKHLSAWQSFLLYHGGFTFDSDNPTKRIKIPNLIAARRIVAAILDHYGLELDDVDIAIDIFTSTGDITKLLKLYQCMSRHDIGEDDFDKNEAIHTRTFNHTLLKNINLKTQLEYVVTGKIPAGKDVPGRVGLAVEDLRHVIVLEWK